MNGFWPYDAIGGKAIRELGYEPVEEAGSDNDGTCNTLTADYHAPAVAFAQNTRNEVRLQGGDETVVGALGASGSANRQGVPFVMATGQANAEVTEDMTPTLNCAHEQPIVVSGASTQYGDEVAGTFTARGYVIYTLYGVAAPATPTEIHKGGTSYGRQHRLSMRYYQHS